MEAPPAPSPPAAEPGHARPVAPAACHPEDTGARRVLATLIVFAAIFGAAAVATFEWLLLVIQDRDLFAGPVHLLLLLPLGFGNLLGYALIVSALLGLLGLLGLLDVACRALASQVRWPRLAVGVLVGLAAVPYAVWRGKLVFSGPQARAMGHRSLLIAACSVFIAATFVVATWFCGDRRTSRRGGPMLAVTLAVGAAAPSWLSRSAFQNEYEPLHGYLGLWSVLFAVLAGRQAVGASAQSAAARKERARDVAPNIIIFSLDGLRRDHVGAYGYDKHPTTPNIDRLAKRGVVFLNAFSSYPATQVFNSTLLLGRSLTQYGGDQQPPEYRSEAITKLLDKRGYHSFVKTWLEHSSRNKFDPKPFKIDTYLTESQDKQHPEKPMGETLAKLKTHIAKADDKKQPVFAWLHFLGTHPVNGGNFAPHPDYDFGRSRMDRYDSAVAGSDLWLAEIERMMSERPGDRSTIWILTSDHGANTDKASRDLYDGVARVPLIIVAPGIGPRTEPALIDTSLDLAATVVDLAGITPPKEYDGMSLVPVLQKSIEGDPTADRIVPLTCTGLSGAVYRGFKFIKDEESASLFNLADDPAERRNLVGARGDLLDQMITVAEVESAHRRRDAEKAGAGESYRAKPSRRKKAR